MMGEIFLDINEPTRKLALRLLLAVEVSLAQPRPGTWRRNSTQSDWDFRSGWDVPCSVSLVLARPLDREYVDANVTVQVNDRELMVDVVKRSPPWHPNFRMRGLLLPRPAGRRRYTATALATLRGWIAGLAHPTPAHALAELERRRACLTRLGIAALSTAGIEWLSFMIKLSTESSHILFLSTVDQEHPLNVDSTRWGQGDPYLSPRLTDELDRLSLTTVLIKEDFPVSPVSYVCLTIGTLSTAEILDVGPIEKLRAVAGSPEGCTLLY